MCINIDNNRNSIIPPLIHASIKGKYGNVLKLIEKGEDTNQRRPEDGATALMFAATYGHFDVVKLLMEHGADINKVTYDGNNALFFTVVAGHVEIIEHLIEFGAPVDKGCRNVTPLEKASSLGNLKVVELLIKRGAVINRGFFDGSNALCLAKAFGHENVVKFLKSKGAKLDVSW